MLETDSGVSRGILVVEDDEQLQTALSTVLSQHGYDDHAPTRWQTTQYSTRDSEYHGQVAQCFLPDLLTADDVPPHLAEAVENQN